MGALRLALASAGSLLCVAVAQGQSPILLDRRVHSPSGTFELWPSIALDLYGRSLVAWESNADGTILFRAFDEHGDPVADQVVANTPANNYRTVLGLSTERNGRAVISWGGAGELGPDSAGPYARCLETGSQLACEVFAVARQGLGLSGDAPSVDLRSDGTMAFAWYISAGGAPAPRVGGAFFSPAGDPLGQTFQVDGEFDTQTEARSSPRVAALGPDRMVVVWSEVGADSSGHGVQGQLFSGQGLPLGPPFVLSTFEFGDQVAPDVAASEDGRFVTVWESWGQDGSDQGIYGQRFTADGVKVGGEFQVSSSAPTGQSDPSVDMDSGGRFAVSWSSHQEPADGNKEIFARAYAADGVAIGPQVWVTQAGSPGDEQEQSDVAISDSGILAVAYESYRHDPETGQDSKDILASWFTLPCSPDPETLCLGEGRFRMRAFWRDYAGRSGRGQMLPLTDGSGGFWFFSGDNFELLAKIVDGCSYNGNFWFFAAGLTDVQVEVLVEDSWTGTVSVFESLLGTPFAPIQTIDSFPTCGAQPRPTSYLREPLPTGAGLTVLSSCTSGGTAICLQDGRFSVSVHWSDFAGRSGEATGFAVGEDSALFTFFSSDNIEIAAKVVDGCSFNERFWVYLSGLTNVEVRTTIVDTSTGASWSRTNSLGHAFSPIFDTSAFDTCAIEASRAR